MYMIHNRRSIVSMLFMHYEGPCVQGPIKETAYQDISITYSNIAQHDVIDK